MFHFHLKVLTTHVRGFLDIIDMNILRVIFVKQINCVACFILVPHCVRSRPSRIGWPRPHPNSRRWNEPVGGSPVLTTSPGDGALPTPLLLTQQYLAYYGRRYVHGYRLRRHFWANSSTLVLTHHRNFFTVSRWSYKLNWFHTKSVFQTLIQAIICLFWTWSFQSDA